MPLPVGREFGAASADSASQLQPPVSRHPPALLGGRGYGHAHAPAPAAVLGDIGTLWEPDFDEGYIFEDPVEGGYYFDEQDGMCYYEDMQPYISIGQHPMFCPPRGSPSMGSSYGSGARSSATSDIGTSLLSGFFAPPPELSAAALPSMPRCFLCPIGDEVMVEPVTASDGATYERENILAYFNSGRRTSPATGAELPSFELRPNEALKEAIQGYRDLHSGAEQLLQGWESYMQQQGQRAAQRFSHRQRQIRALRSALEQSDRRIQALSARRDGDDFSATASTDDTLKTPSAASPAAVLAPSFKSGPAPRLLGAPLALPAQAAAASAAALAAAEPAGAAESRLLGGADRACGAGAEGASEGSGRRASQQRKKFKFALPNPFRSVAGKVGGA